MVIIVIIDIEQPMHLVHSQTNMPLSWVWCRQFGLFSFTLQHPRTHLRMNVSHQLKTGVTHQLKTSVGHEARNPCVEKLLKLYLPNIGF